MKILPQSRRLLEKLGRRSRKRVRIEATVRDNARRMKRSWAMPAELWIELTREFRRRKAITDLKTQKASADTLFMIGVACGWAEARARLKAKS